jgi:DNA-binding CsgD family transcriptional regulator
VRTHFRRIRDKLHLRNRAEAIAYATRNHLPTTPH